jgi:hypothetical protein
MLNAASSLLAQQPPPPPAAAGQPPQGGAPGAGRGGGRGGGGAPAAPLADDNTGFVELFDGTLNNWEGDMKFWRAEDRPAQGREPASKVIVGESTPDKVVAQNTFLIWKGGTTKDFELKLEFRMSGTNSGVQYRSDRLTGPDLGPFVLKGYQADMDFVNQYTGMLYEERGRTFLARRGQISRVAEDGKVKLIGSVGDSDTIKGSIQINGWNTLHVIARGQVIIHVLNGRVSAVLIDEDEKGRIKEGALGFQMHVGPPFKVEFRNIWYKKL